MMADDKNPAPKKSKAPTTGPSMLGEPGEPATATAIFPESEKTLVGVAYYEVTDPVTVAVNGVRTNLMPGSVIPKGVDPEDVASLAKAGALALRYTK